MDFSNIINMMNEAYTKNYFHNMAMVVGDKDGILFKHFINADENSLFDLASLTKIVATTMIALRFIEEGKLSLNESISDYLEVPLSKKGITIKHLMTHTSGFEPFFNIEKATTTNPVETILDRPLFDEIGGNVHYSCIGYIILGKILEKIGGENLHDLASEYVFDPLSLTSMTFAPDKTLAIPTAIHPSTQERFCGVVHDDNARFLKIAANAGLFSNIGDMSIFARMLSNFGDTTENRFLTYRMMEKAVINYTPGMNECRGLGFSINNNNGHPSGDLFATNSFGHTGYTGTSMYTAFYYIVILF